jgi:hypothetical protein
MADEAIRLVNQQINELRQLQDSRAKANPGVGSTPDKKARDDELSAVLQELRDTKAVLLSTTRALEKEKQAHEQTKELLRLALKPPSQTLQGYLVGSESGAHIPGGSEPALGHLHRQGSSSPAGRSQSPPHSNAVYVPPLDFQGGGAGVKASPWRQPPTTSPHLAQKYAHYGSASPGGASAPLQELLARATGTSTPRRSAVETRRAVQQLCGTQHPKSASKESGAFGSRTPRFQTVSLVGDHALFQSSRSWSYADDVIGSPQQRTNRGTPSRNQSPGTSRTTTPRRPVSAGTTKLTAVAVAAAAHANTEAPPANPSHALRSPDVQGWIHDLQHQQTS